MAEMFTTALTAPSALKVQDSSEFLQYLGYVTLIARSKHFVLEHKCDKRDNFC